MMTGDPIGIYRHHRSCQLGTLGDEDNCARTPLKGRHYGLRLCEFHLDMIEALVAEAIHDGTIGDGRRHPVRHRARAAA